MPIAPLSIRYTVDPMSFEPKEEIILRTLKQMRDAFVDKEAADEMLKDGDTTIVEVFMAEIPNAEGELMVNINTVYPGKVGDEYFMTKGHIHSDHVHNPEIYVTVRGKGKLLLQKLDGEVFVSDLEENVISYIPADCAHRCINTGDEPLTYLGFFPADTDRDYSFGKGDKRFKHIFVEEQGEPVMKLHPDLA